MRAIVVQAPGGPEALEFHGDYPVPEPGPQQVRIRVAYAGLNFFDVLIRRGDYMRNPKYPLVPGGECSGVVDAVGEGVDGGLLGKRVAALTGDRTGYSEFAIAPAESTFVLPDSVDFKTAAAFPLQVLTAWGVFHASARPRPTDWVLVHAAAGGVGQALVQLAKLHGCTVIATASSAEKLEVARSLGADHLINYKEQDFGRAVRELRPQGVELILDSVGKDVKIGNLRALAYFGLIVVFGYASGEAEYENKLLWRSSVGTTFNGLYHLLMVPELAQRAVKETLGALLAGKLKLHIDSVHPLEDVQAAQRKLEGRGTIGKVLLEVNPGL
jgi:NADPH2:quinone reductase